MRKDGVLICPVCAEGLSDAGRALVCVRGHTFDRAREGYVDLLPPGHGRTNIAGDSAEMVDARRRFLTAGHYSRLLEAITAHARDPVALQGERGSGGVAGAGEALSNPPLLLDAGCGDGYYGGNVAAAIARQCGGCRLYGLDISRAALKVAARSWRDGVFFRNDVATRICLADGSADVLLDIFAPRNAGEFARVLRPGGLALVVIPDESHLHELRATLPLLSIPAEKRERTREQLAAHFTLRHESAVQYAMALRPSDLRDLVTMSPSAHHVDEAHVQNLTDMQVTASFRVLRFARTD